MNNFHFHTDGKGKDLSKLINNYNLTILNDGTPTMADFATAPDLTLATTEMSPHTTWNPINQSCGSEHLPILISLGVKYDVIINTLDDALGDVPNLSLSQFANDSAIWTKHSSPRLALNKIQSALDEIEIRVPALGLQDLNLKD